MSAGTVDIKQKDKEIEEERRLEETKTKFRRRFAGYREEIDSLLEREVYGELLDYQKTEHFRELILLENEAAIMNVVMSIYHDEIENGSEKKILDGIHNMRQARERYLQGKFTMWRLEFFDEGDEFLEFVAQNPVSSYFLMHLIYTSSFEKGDTALKMAMLLKEKQKFSQAFAMLNYLNQLCPDEEIVYCEMADICICAGQTLSASDCIGKIKNPSGMLAEYRKKWGI